ncbi:unnamed protein product [Auanema sp. JU1783]|nr:unnamed protein product [Auanema sp. JU1783]
MSFGLCTEENPVDPPSYCESCVIFAQEFQNKTTRIHTKSESEVLDMIQNICDSMFSYKIHKEKKGVGRFSKEESETMQVLKKLRSQGVKVDLGLPEDMWDAVGVEVQLLKQRCELIIAEYEDEIVEWFLSDRNISFEDFLCRQRFLEDRRADMSCLSSHSQSLAPKVDL